MESRSRTEIDINVFATTLRGEWLLDADQLAAAAGVSRATLERLVRLGLVQPAAPDGGAFTAAAAARLLRMLRLRQDLGLNLAGAEIVVELLDRLERAERELERMRRGG